MSDLEAIKARAAAATKGPWRADPGGCAPYVDAPSDDIATNVYEMDDARFIAHAREDVPRLVAALEAVEALCKDKDGGWLESHFDGNTVGDIRAAIRTALEGAPE